MNTYHNYSTVKKLIANPGEKRFYEARFAIANEFGIICYVYANHVQDALDIAADSGKLDCQLLEDWQYKEALENNWDDSYILLGNASEPFSSMYLTINEI